MRELSVSAAPEPVEEFDLVDAAAQVSAWCGEPLLYEGDDPAMTLAPGAARRRALDAALEEIATGLDAPSPAWRFRFSLMLGLERVLAADQPALLNGLTLRPHQVDALAGMLAALTAGEEREDEADDAEAEADEEDELNAAEAALDELEAEELSDDDDEDDEDDDERPEGEEVAVEPRRPPRTARTRTTAKPPQSPRSPIPAPCAATASSTPRRRARRSRPPASSRPAGRWAC